MILVMKSYTECVAIAAKEFPYITNEDALVDFLPKKLFGKAHEVVEIEKDGTDTYYRIQDEDDLYCTWHVDEKFIAEVNA